MTFDVIFNLDEMELRDVDPQWGRDELLMQKGIFFLKDLDTPLNISRKLLFRKREELVADEQDPWLVMGLRKIWGHWQVRMKIFAPFYRQHLVLPYAKVPEGWDANSVAQQTEGIYLLHEICRLIPFTTQQLRYKVRALPDSKRTMGVWRDPTTKVYLVDLATFGPWLKATWKEGFPKDSPEPDMKKRPTP